MGATMGAGFGFGARSTTDFPILLALMPGRAIDISLARTITNELAGARNDAYLGVDRKFCLAGGSIGRFVQTRTLRREP
jgi:hypothetical protein